MQLSGLSHQLGFPFVDYFQFARDPGTICAAKTLTNLALTWTN